MFIDARSLSDGDRLETDICIVGAGPAGLTIAQTLAGRGTRICLVESGGIDPDNSEHMQSTRDLNVGRNVGLGYFRLDEARGRGLGGTSTRWNIPIRDDATVGVRLPRLEPIDFETRDGLPHSGWPLTYADLEPYYVRAAGLCGIDAHPPSPSDWALRNARKPLPLNADVVETTMFQVGPANVWYGPDTVARLNKSEMKVLLNGTVTQIETEEGAQRVSGVQLRTLDRRNIHIAAKTVVIACGGIGNAHLLLLSDSMQRGGLGNGHDLVGRYFMEHPHLGVGVIVPDGPGVFERTALYQIHRSGNAWVEGHLKLTESRVRREQLRGCVAALYAVPWDSSLRYLENLADPTTGDAAAELFGAALKRRTWPYNAGTLAHKMAADSPGALRAFRRGITTVAHRTRRVRKDGDAPPEVLALHVMAEQEPHADSRVLLDRRNRDALGRPRVRLDWRVTDADISAISRSLALIGREIKTAGLGRFHAPLHHTLPSRRLTGGKHHMGTTRMHVDPTRGVVNADCQVHGIENLYIAGSSVFPTGGYANPTLTVVALALRLADHLAHRFS